MRVLGIICFLLGVARTVVGFRRLYSDFENKSYNVSDFIDEIPFDSSGIINRRMQAGPAMNGDSHRVWNLPGLDESVSSRLVQYAGHVEINSQKGSNIFYWLFEKPDNPLDAPLLIWLNGGPGCSSMDGLFLEIGPFRIDPSANVVRMNRHSWHNVANLLIIDQPVGTGLSFTKAKDGYATNDQAVSEQFYQFLQLFFKLHPRYTSLTNTAAIAKGGPKAGERAVPITKSRKLIMSGESHAGHYIPTMSVYFRKANQLVVSKVLSDGNNGNVYIDMDGMVLGNPWIDPVNQYDVSTFAHGLGLITSGQKTTLKELNKQCQSMLRKGQLKNRVCMNLLDLVIDSSSLPGHYAKVSMYDIRKFFAKSNVYPIGHEDVERYLNRMDVRTAIHADRKTERFVECADPPFVALAHQDGKGVLPELVSELNEGNRLLLFSGQYDIVCNHLGSEMTLSRLNWTGLQGWLQAQRGIWLVNNKPAGYIKAYQNLMYLLVLNCGHMVPMDEPVVALDMITKFINKAAYGSGPAKIQMSSRLMDFDDSRLQSYTNTSQQPKMEDMQPPGTDERSSSLGRMRGTRIDRKLEHQSMSESNKLFTQQQQQKNSSPYDAELPLLCSGKGGLEMRSKYSQVDAECIVAITLFVRKLGDANWWIKQAHHDEQYNEVMKKMISKDIELSIQPSSDGANVGSNNEPIDVLVSSVDAVVVDLTKLRRSLSDTGDSIQEVVVPLPPDASTVSLIVSQEQRQRRSLSAAKPTADTVADLDSNNIYLRSIALLVGSKEHVIVAMKSLCKQVNDESSQLRKGMITSHIGFQLAISTSEEAVTLFHALQLDSGSNQQTIANKHTQAFISNSYQVLANFTGSAANAVAFLCLFIVLIILGSKLFHSCNNNSSLNSNSNDSSSARKHVNNHLLMPHRQQIFSSEPQKLR